MQIHRLFEIVYILLNKNSITAQELADHFEVSVRTIYRDIEVLTLAQIPIYTTQGKGGGIALLDSYVLNKSMLTDHEQSEILFALQSLAVTQNPEITTILAKLSGLFNKNKDNWIEVDFSSWGNNNQSEQFTILKNAIIDQKMVIFDYFNALGEDSHRKVEPIKLIFKSSAWYLQGFCLSRREQRTFKISRMSDIKTTEEPFVVEIKNSEDKPLNEDPPVKQVEVCLKFSKDGAYRAFDFFDRKTITQNADGAFTVNALLPGGEWLVNFLFSFGPVVEVIKPTSIRTAVIKKLEENMKIYKSNL
jgi:predicted DNA-binding transcriptional regulator YafY